jgi:hypothetical protein
MRQICNKFVHIAQVLNKLISTFRPAHKCVFKYSSPGVALGITVVTSIGDYGLCLTNSYLFFFQFQFCSTFLHGQSFLSASSLIQTQEARCNQFHFQCHNCLHFFCQSNCIRFAQQYVVDEIKYVTGRTSEGDSLTAQRAEAREQLSKDQENALTENGLSLLSSDY